MSETETEISLKITIMIIVTTSIIPPTIKNVEDEGEGVTTAEILLVGVRKQ